eukprot:gnl/MRDRNA2_/MRDRNA2_111539_c0_seq1.p1 gnl/MRDRNA2_/MRDRNA2_111539_c0~~gnl/MRDRNA2_/MRDRNA2_111539_c0_seq1.p1  ORF type:complete len:409 (-),score=103.91 gnl/MRDRNA2_/MRDRNA2_111539_c0_seq1:89-1315(-)
MFALAALLLHASIDHAHAQATMEKLTHPSIVLVRWRALVNDARLSPTDLDGTVFGKPSYFLVPTAAQSSSQWHLHAKTVRHTQARAEGDFSLGAFGKTWAKKAKEAVKEFNKEVSGGDENYDVTKDLADKAKDAVKEFGKEVTGNENFEVKDLSKTLKENIKPKASFKALAARAKGNLSPKTWVDATKEGMTEFGKEVTGKDDYKLSDTTQALTAKAKENVSPKAWFEATKEGITEFGKEVTGNEEYKLSDTTNALAAKVQESVTPEAWAQGAGQGITEFSKELTAGKGLRGQPLQPCSSESLFCTYVDGAAWSGQKQVCVAVNEDWRKAKGVDPVDNWCVGVWDYARVISDQKKAAGLDLVCDATNGLLREFYKAYLTNPLMMKQNTPIWYDTKAASEKVEEQCGVA